MTHAHQKSNYSDFDAMQASERRSSQRSVLSIERAYVPYASRPEPHHESRTYVLPTPIHDIEQDSDQGSRKRTTVACGRCRRRKIKCRGGPPCLNCRNAGVDASACIYQRVGTKHTFDIDTSVVGSAPISPYSPISPAYPIPYSTDERTSAVPVYIRSGHPQSYLPTYNYDVHEAATSSVPYTTAEDVRSWNSAHRAHTTISYYESEAPTAYDYPTPLSRAPSNASEPLSPLNMSNLQSSLPPPIERRLPAPNLVGSLMSPESNDPRNPISARLSALCISSPYNRNSGTAWTASSATQPVDERRRPSIQDLADASMMLPPVTRGLIPATIPTSNPESSLMPSAMYGSSQPSDGLTPIQNPPVTTQQAYYSINSTLPPLNTGMLPPANYARYTSNERSTQSTGYYSWSQASNGTESLPVVASVEIPQSNHSTTSSNSSTPTQSRYPPLHHPRPNTIPSPSYAVALEKHDRVSSKDGRGSKSHSQNKTSQSSRGKKDARKGSKGSL